MNQINKLISENYKISRVVESDLSNIRLLSPEGWGDISIRFKEYIEYECYLPIKIINQDKIVAVGCLIMHQSSAWLAHIIVSSGYRNKGLGHMLVEYLLKESEARGINTVSLIATKLGEFLYLKHNFCIFTEYVFLEIDSLNNIETKYENICICNDEDYKAVLELDRKISGEDRGKIIKLFLADTYVYKVDGTVKGYYIVGWGEGLIIAEDPRAGLELLKLKIKKDRKVVLPKENEVAIKYLKSLGFMEKSRGKRMVNGEVIPVELNKVFSRIGGNLG